MERARDGLGTRRRRVGGSRRQSWRAQPRARRSRYSQNRKCSRRTVALLGPNDPSSSGDKWESKLYDHLTKEERVDGSSHFRFVGGLKSERMAKSKRRVHFVGIGGAGLSNLAQLAMERGWLVTGSDIRDSPKLTDLRAKGALVDVGHSEGNVLEREGVDCLPDAIVVSSAVSADNVELRCALKYNIPLYKRGAWLGRVTQGYDTVSVAGTHGKTTSTAMMALVLDAFEMKKDNDGVTAIVGGDVAQFKRAPVAEEDEASFAGAASASGSLVGASNLFVLEADEYDRAFLDLQSKYAVITNIELDHLDIYESEDDLFGAFDDFVANVAKDGGLVVCGDDQGCRTLMEMMRERDQPNCAGAEASTGPVVETYGLEETNDWRATDVVVSGRETSFQVEYKGEALQRVVLPMVGTHNVVNALGVMALTSLIQSPLSRQQSQGKNRAGTVREVVKTSAGVLGEFQGVERRCQVLGEKNQVMVVSDYAHHPTEVEATMAAMSDHFETRDLLVVFEPHTLSRLAYFFTEFSQALSQSQKIFVMPVFEPIKTYINAKVKDAIAEDLAKDVASDAVYLKDTDLLVQEVVREAATRESAVVLVLGAGSSHRVATQIYKNLQ